MRVGSCLESTKSIHGGINILYLCGFLETDLCELESLVAASKSGFNGLRGSFDLTDAVRTAKRRAGMFLAVKYVSERYISAMPTSLPRTHRGAPSPRPIRAGDPHLRTTSCITGNEEDTNDFRTRAQYAEHDCSCL